MLHHHQSEGEIPDVDGDKVEERPSTRDLESDARSHGDRYNRLLIDCAKGDLQAEARFFTEIQHWIEKKYRKAALQIPDIQPIDRQDLDDAAADILLPLLEAIRAGDIVDWQRFSTRFHKDLQRRTTMLRQARERNAEHLEARVPNADVSAQQTDRPREEWEMLNEPAKVFLHETLSSKSYPEAHQAENLDADELWGRIKSMVDTLGYRKREILNLRYGIDQQREGDGVTYTLEQVGKIFRIDKERVRQLQVEALKELRDSAHAALLAPFEERIGEEQGSLLTKRMNESEELQRRKNNRILWDIEEDIVPHKETIRAIVEPYGMQATRLFKDLEVEQDIAALSDVEWTKMDQLIHLEEWMKTNRAEQALRSLVTHEEYQTVSDAIRKIQEQISRFVELGGKRIRPRLP